MIKCDYFRESRGEKIPCKSQAVVGVCVDGGKILNGKIDIWNLCQDHRDKLERNSLSWKITKESIIKKGI